MPFPESPRVVYGRNPLEEVICQVRFPGVLRIDSEPPAGFQEQIRAEYPLFKERLGGLQPGLTIPDEVANLLGGIFGSRAEKAYDFTSQDNAWQITLTRNFLALACRRYTRWEQFWERLSQASAALNGLYQPVHYTRLGLRYRDVIVRSKLGLQGTPWSRLLQGHIAGMLSSGVAQDINQIAGQVLVGLGNGNGTVNIQHGTARTADGNEECYYIDSDFFSEGRIEINDAARILGYFNRQSGCLFRWCITEPLHNALEPERIAA